MQFQTRPDIAALIAEMLLPKIKTVLEPTPGEGNIVSAIRAMRPELKITAPKDYWKLRAGRFDAAVMNPPFTPMKEGYRFLYSVMDRTDMIIALMPWLTLINGERRLNKILDYGLVSVTHLPRSIFPGSRVQCCIMEMVKGWTKPTEFLFYGK